MTRQAPLDKLSNIGPIFRATEAVEAGVSWRDLYLLRDEGELLELSRGLYQLRDAAGVDNIDFISVSARAPRGMICLNSALAHWDLSDEIPPVVHLAIPRGSHRPIVDYPPTEVHVFSARSFDVGREEVAHGERERFAITSRERTVVDAFRLRHLVGHELAHDAIRRYLRSKPQIPLLSEVGKKLRAGAAFGDTIRLLLA